MKVKATLVVLSICITFVYGQISGNINYSQSAQIPQSYINATTPTSNQILLSIKGLSNVKADAYLAIFSVNQVGKTEEEAQNLIDQRISSALSKIQNLEQVESYVDMISFVPKYEFEVQKRIFSKTTYNEVPAGFEIKKNIHLKFKDPKMLNKMVKLFAQNEIYDLVRVDYIIEDMEEIKMQMLQKAKDILKSKIQVYQEILGVCFDNYSKSFNEEYEVFLPVEMYKSYEAANSQNLSLWKSAHVKKEEKVMTTYYQPVFNKDFDFVMNPVIIEPVVQVLYEFKLRMLKVDKPEYKNNHYVLITPNGDLRSLDIAK